jgi:hypothetical protein
MADNDPKIALDVNWEKAALASKEIAGALNGVTEAAKQAKLYEDSHHIVRNEKTGQVDWGTKYDELSKPEHEESLHKLSTANNIADNKLANFAGFKDGDNALPHAREIDDLVAKATAAGIKMATEVEAHELKSLGTGGAKPVPAKGQTTPD